MEYKKTAVIFDTQANLASLGEQTNILLFEKTDDGWSVTDEIPFGIDYTQGLSSVRNQVNGLIQSLEDCKIIIGKGISGIPYSVFDKMGFCVFETDTFNASTLDEVVLDIIKEEQINQQKLEQINSLGPSETEISGVYTINLIELQLKYPDVSSKKLLRPFLSDTPFYSLEIICNHIPPWLLTELPEKNMEHTQETLPNGTEHMVITPKVCKE
ncbi:MAG: anfO [Oscillospiraceae bacterium]|nr:anfO [Oscillospiraceae bacterium]